MLVKDFRVLCVQQLTQQATTTSYCVCLCGGMGPRRRVFSGPRQPSKITAKTTQQAKPGRREMQKTSLWPSRVALLVFRWTSPAKGDGSELAATHADMPVKAGGWRFWCWHCSCICGAMPQGGGGRSLAPTDRSVEAKARERVGVNLASRASQRLQQEPHRLRLRSNGVR